MPLYAAHPVGTPIANPALTVTNTSVQYSDGVLTVTFARRFNSGQSPIDPSQETPVIWAVGPSYVPLSSCDASPPYHNFNRGIRFVAFAQPDAVLPDSHKCAS